MDANLTPIVDYIRQNRQTYTREAITDRLISSGYKPEQIEAAWQIVGIDYKPVEVAVKDDSPPTDRRFANKPVFWLALLLFIGAAYGAGAFILAAISGNVDFFLASPGGMLFMVITGAFILIIFIAGFLLVDKNRPLGMGLIIGGALSLIILPIVALGLFFGVCMSIFAA